MVPLVVFLNLMQGASGSKSVLELENDAAGA